MYNDDVRAWVALLPSLIAFAFHGPLGINDPDRRTMAMVQMLLILWTIFCVTYLALTVVAFKRLYSGPFLMAVAKPKKIKRNPVARALSLGGSLSWALQGSLVAVGAVLVVSVRPPAEQSDALKILAVLCVVSSWLLVMVSQALAYARLGAEARAGETDVENPLEFRGTPAADFSDYLTLAATVSSSLAPQGVEITGRQARSVVRTHTVLAFIFNSVVLAVLVSMLITSTTSGS